MCCAVRLRMPTTVACLNKLINTYLNHLATYLWPANISQSHGIRLIVLKFFLCARFNEMLDLTLDSGFVLPIMSCLLIIDFVGTRH